SAAIPAEAQIFTRADVLPGPFGATQGSSWSDFDGGGDYDLFGANGNVFEPGGRNHLYRNRGDGTFETVVQGSIVEDRMTAFSGAWGDYDGDSDPDLLVAGSEGDDFFAEVLSRPRIYRNEGFGK